MKNNKTESPTIRTKVYSTSEGKVAANNKRRRRFVRENIGDQPVKIPTTCKKHFTPVGLSGKRRTNQGSSIQPSLLAEKRNRI